MIAPSVNVIYLEVPCFAKGDMVDEALTRVGWQRDLGLVAPVKVVPRQVVVSGVEPVLMIRAFSVAAREVKSVLKLVVVRVAD